MAGDPAIRKVLVELRDLLSGIAGLNVIIDRDEKEPLEGDELPAVVIFITDWDFTQPEGEQGQTKHVVTGDMEFQSGGDGIGEIDAVNQVSISEVNAQIHTDKTLGGRLENLAIFSASGQSQGGVMIGAAIVRFEAVFWTPNDDFTTIIGQSGGIF